MRNKNSAYRLGYEATIGNYVARATIGKTILKGVAIATAIAAAIKYILG